MPTVATVSPSTSTSALVVSVAVTTVPPLMRVRTRSTSRCSWSWLGAFGRPHRGPDRLDRLADVGFGHAQRRGQAQRVAVQPALADQQAALPAVLHHAAGGGRVRLLGAPVGHHLDADHQALAAHLSDAG